MPTALSCLTMAARDSPGDVRLLFDRSQCFVALARYEQAAVDLSRALLLRPRSVPLLYHRACAFMELQRWKAAGRDLEAAVKVSGKSECVYEADLWEGSKFLTGTTEPPPFTCDCWLRLGCMRVRGGQWVEALQAFKTAAASETGNSEVLYELAAAFQHLGRYQEAAAAFSAVLARHPRDAVVLMQRGLALHALKRYEEAASDMEAAKKLQPEDARFCIDYRCVDMRRAALTEPGDWAKHELL
jgi:tetratricopeptide (TPR) repeat protein